MQMHDILQQDPETWRLFTCAEEYNSTFRDCYDRFPHYLSTNRAPFEPHASRYLVGQGYRPEYPDGQPFAVCLTHDIDVIYRSVLSKGYAALVMEPSCIERCRGFVYRENGRETTG